MILLSSIKLTLDRKGRKEKREGERKGVMERGEEGKREKRKVRER